MISPSYNSVDYGAMLKAPVGYAVDFAIATTYSLDLHALMGAYLSLGLLVDTDSSLAADPMYLFAALSEMRDKMMVFCEKGRILGRGEYSSLYCQLESSIVEVDLPEASTESGYFKYPSFHPKTWLIRFTPTDSAGPARYRFCILSRNLTFDTSWDLAGCFDGDYREQHRFASGGGNSMRAYVSELRKLYGKGAYSTKLDTIVDEIPYVNFSTTTKEYQLALPFSFTGVPGARTFNQEFADALNGASRVLVMTPFLSAASSDADPIARIARRFEDADNKPILVTRRASIASDPKIAEKLKGFSVFAMRDDLVTAEFERDDASDGADGEAGPAVPDTRDIHAKAYLFERADDASRCDVFAGSANASVKGLFANHEAMMHLTVKRANAFDNLLKELGLTDKEIERGSLFESLSPQTLATLAPPSQDEQNRLRIQREFDCFLRKTSLTMRIKQSEASQDFEVVVTTRGNKGFMDNCTISLATEKTGAPLQKETVFSGMRLDKLTELVRITCENDSFKATRLMKCRLLEGAEFLEKQRRNLFKTVTRNRFSEYLELRLSGNPELVASMSADVKRLGTGSQTRTATRYSGLYENLLRAYATKPDQTTAIVDESLRLLGAEQDNGADSSDDDTESIRLLLETVRKGARHVL